MGSKSRFLEIIPNLLLFFLFVCCMVFVLFSGIHVYKSVSAVADEQFNINICNSYITAKIRHYDRVNGVTVDQIEGKDAILLKETIEKEEYVTFLYCSDGYLKELFCVENRNVDLSAGHPIALLDDFECELQNGLLSFCCQINDKQTETAVYLQSEREALS